MAAEQLPSSSVPLRGSSAAVIRLAVACVAGTFSAPPAFAQEAVYVEKLSVAAPTRLDWVYPLLDQSPEDDPEGLLDSYSSRAQKYEFFGPAQSDPNRSHALIVFISPSDRPTGWRHFGPTCHRHGVLFAGPHDAGNGRPLAERVRITLDVLDDVRRRYNVDAERTYLAGFSGGATVASRIAYHLPEYFGGLIVIGQLLHPPAETWHFHRVRDRLSVALICGSRDPVGDPVVKLFGPLHEALGIRTAHQAIPGLGHAMPSPAVCDRAFQWLEQDAAARNRFAEEYPASSMGQPQSRKAWAALLLAEAKDRLAAPGAAHTGVVQFEWIRARWPDLPEAAEAARLLDELAEAADQTWRRDHEEELRSWLRAHAQVNEAYANAKIDRSLGHTRFEAARAAIGYWRKLLEATDETGTRDEIHQRIASLEEVVASAPPPSKARSRPVGRVTFQGRTTVRELVEFLTSTFEDHGFEFTLDTEGIEAAGVSLDTPVDVQVQNASLEKLLDATLEPEGLTYRRRGNSFRISPQETGRRP